MGIEKVEYKMVAVAVKSVLAISHKQAILDIEAGGFGILQPDVFLPFRKAGKENQPPTGRLLLLQLV